MRLVDITVENSLPIRLFSVAGLSDVVVLAGPNGVGKTRLLKRVIEHLRGGAPAADVRGTVAATNPREVEAWAGKVTLDMSSSDDMNLFRAVLHANRRRHKWQSSLVNFESDRTIQTLKPFQFTWDLPDPYEEEVGWDIASGFMRDRFQDTVNSMYRMIEAQKQSIANRAISLRKEGRDSMKLEFDDPMTPFKEVFAQLLAPKELVDPSARDQRLQYRQDGEILEFSSLSSGEREVVNIGFDFLLRSPEDCIVSFDEPELHLHPELSYKLIQTLQTIGFRNQFFLSTHSPDIITASLDRSVVFISPPKTNVAGQAENQAIPVTEDDDTNQALRLLGQSIGIVALGRRIVLVEGTQSSLDKQTYGSILRGAFPELVLVPSGGKHTLQSFDAVYQSVLSKTVWGVEFFMLCDRDSAPSASTGTEALTTGRLRVLPRYHLENYFLDETVWARAFALMEPPGSWLRSPKQIRAMLRTLASDYVSYATALFIASQFRLRAGNLDLMPNDCHGKTADEVVDLLRHRTDAEANRLSEALDMTAIEAGARGYFEELRASLDSDSDDWKSLIPGKPVLGRFAGKANVDLARAKTMYLNAVATSNAAVFDEILEIFKEFAA